MRECEHLGAEQANPIRAVLIDEVEITHQADVGRQADAASISGLGGSIPQRVSALLVASTDIVMTS